MKSDESMKWDVKFRVKNSTLNKNHSNCLIKLTVWNFGNYKWEKIDENDPSLTVGYKNPIKIVK